MTLTRRGHWAAIAFFLFVLVHVQLNYHHTGYFLGAAILAGLYPIGRYAFLRYLALEGAALAVCLLMKQPDELLGKAVAEVIGVGLIPYTLIVMVVSMLAFALPAAAIQAWVGTSLMKLMGVGIIRPPMQLEAEDSEIEEEEDSDETNS